MTIIEKIERGTDNFKTVDIPRLGISVGLIILPRLTEMEMVHRARQWCKSQDPPIEDADLIKAKEEAFLTWKSLVDPNEPWKMVADGRIPHVVFESVQEMERTLTGDWLEWISEQLVAFRQEVSPFTSAKNFRAIEEMLEKIRKENDLPERFIESFKVVYCARHGMLPTERRVIEMMPDQWWLIFYSLPAEEQALYLTSPLFKKAI